MLTPPAFAAPVPLPSTTPVPRTSTTILPSSFTPSAASRRAPAAMPRGSRPLHNPLMLFSLFQSNDTVLLPQHDTRNAVERRASVEEMRERYEWKYEGIGDAAMVKNLPLPEESPAAGWIAGLAEVLVRTALNSVIEDVDSAIENSVVVSVGSAIASVTAKVLTGQATEQDLYAVFEEIKPALKGGSHGVGRTLEDYKDLFNTIKLDTVVKNDQFLLDDIFGWYRVAGPNPMKLTRLSGDVSDMFPDITDEIFSGIHGFSGDSLAAAAREKRLFYVDYKELEGLPAGKLDGKTKDMYIYAPRCLLAVSRKPESRMTVLPIAIHCGQGPSYPMFTANPSHTEAITWVAAKYAVQSSDAVVHELIYHLGRCHLLEEAMLVSTYRSFAETHPLHRLLKPSFYGTALINAAAVVALINNGGIIDRITAPDIDTSRGIAARSINDPSFNFNNWMPDAELSARGVMDDELKFPYRDDALAHWKALNKFVGKFVDAYYHSDADVVADYELQHFSFEVTKNGRIHGFGETADGKIKTKAYLVRMLSMIMFTASVQHAALNYPQSTLMQFVPSMPLAATAPAPTTPNPFNSINDWLTKMAPKLPEAETQLQALEIIGVMRYGMVGEYGKGLEFAPDEVSVALELFQEELGVLGAKIQERNMGERANGLPIYNFQVPKNVPLSINI